MFGSHKASLQAWQARATLVLHHRYTQRPVEMKEWMKHQEHHHHLLMSAVVVIRSTVAVSIAETDTALVVVLVDENDETFHPWHS